MKSLSWIAAFVLGATTAAGAQDTLSLPSAIQEALTRNRSLQSAQSSAREADTRVSEARAAWFPRVSAAEAWQRGDQPVFVFSSLLASRRFAAANFAIDSLNFPSPTGFFHGTVSFDQTVFDGGRTGAAIDIARRQAEVAQFTADDESGAIVVSVTETYGRALTAHALVRSADAAIVAAQEDVTRAERRRDAGSLSEADVLAVAVHLADMRQRRIRASGDELAAKAELNRLLAAPIDRQFDVEDPAPATGETARLAVLFDEAESRRPDLKRAGAAEQFAEAAQRQARSSWSPHVAVQGTIAADGTSFGDRSSSWLIGGEVRWSLSTGGAEAAQRRAAAETVVRARLEHEDARARAQVEIATAVQRLDSAIARRDLAQAAAESARESERIVRDRFDAGLASTSDLLRAAAAMTDADAQRASALVETIVSRTLLDRALGRPAAAAARSRP